MSDVIIKGMEMPESCSKCFMIRSCRLTIPSNGRNNNCSIRPAPEWISVEERLPETRDCILGQKSSKVIVAFQFDDGIQGTDTAHTLNGNWVFEDRITVVNRTVTHWMPLPEPPEGGGRDG